MDKDIFEALYRRYYAPALLYAQGLCRSRHLAEDMVQEAFCRAWLSLPGEVTSFRGWLFRVLRNLIIDHREHSMVPTTHIKGNINTEDIRKMTPREWARLQGFPDSYELPLADTHLYKQMGNTVTVPVIEAIARQIKAVLDTVDAPAEKDR